MDIQKFKIKKDLYQDHRGGWSKFLNIYCDHCGEHILLYQKDGPGPLKRLYIDRIFAPEEISSLVNKNLKDICGLRCKVCNRLIGIPANYEKENRKAFLLLSYVFIKKIAKGIYPPEIKRIDVR
jgi:hypothetical protein